MGYKGPDGRTYPVAVVVGQDVLAKWSDDQPTLFGRPSPGAEEAALQSPVEQVIHLNCGNAFNAQEGVYDGCTLFYCQNCGFRMVVDNVSTWQALWERLHGTAGQVPAPMDAKGPTG